MDAIIKAAWIAALRSGEYTQGVETLSSQDEGQPACHCVMGVLCELAVRAGVGVIKREALQDEVTTFFSYDGQEKFLPIGVQQWAGLNTNNPRVGAGPRLRLLLMAINDSKALGFADLADLLEEDLTF